MYNNATDFMTSRKAMARIKKTEKSLIMGRKGYPPAVGKFLSENKAQIIKHIIVARTPIQSMIKKFLDKFGGETEYDELFHLRLQVTCQSGFKFTIEKNAVITVTNKFRRDKNDEHMNIHKVFDVTIDEFLSNAERGMGAKYFKYHPSSSNCQDFCIGLLTNNGMNDQSVITFIKQQTEAVFKKHPNFRKFAATMTDLGGKADVVIQGGNINGFNQLKRSELVDLIKKWKKVNVVNHSGMRKAELVAYLDAHFDIVNDVLQLKSKTQKKRITPVLVSQSESQGNIPQNTGALSVGQQKFASKVDRMITKEEMKAQLKGHQNFAKKIRGHK